MDNPEATPRTNAHSRLGVHYHEDDQHFRLSDLNTWMPGLKRLGIAWLVLTQPANNAIPEPFIRELDASGVAPLLHLRAHPLALPPASEWAVLFHAYAKWGLKYVILFDQPNSRMTWPPSAWAQADLVERFLDVVIPLAQCAQDAGLTAVLPPLAPGGDYWDTAFLRDCLQGFADRGRSELLSQMALTAYANVTHTERPLPWGAGGPERWPGARPYFTPEDQQDQRGFYIFHWYTAISQAIAGKPLPLILLGAGRGAQHGGSESAISTDQLTTRLLSVARLMSKNPDDEETRLVATPEGECEPVPEYVLACAFELAPPENAAIPTSGDWLNIAANPHPTLAALEGWASHAEEPQPTSPPANPKILHPHPIRHYVLFSPDAWELAEGRLEAIRPFVRKHLPTMGFSLSEACQARRVTLVGGPNAFSDEEVKRLHVAGCEVERIAGDGTNIASILNSL